MKSPFRKRMIILGIVTLIDLLILFTRNWITADSTYNFLLWNLFLGFLPLLFTCVLYMFKTRYNTLLFICGSFLWLLFYPNAPYMLTDFIHVNSVSSTVIYDALIIFSISILSLFYGLFSLKLIYMLWRDRYNHKFAIAVVIFSILLSSFGIYLGRILRLNSWDLFSNPLQVMAEIFGHLWPVYKNPATYCIILLFSIIQGIMLWMIHDYENLDETGK